MVVQTTFAWTSWGGLGGKQPFDLGGGTLVSRPSVSGCVSWWSGRRLHGRPGVASAASCPSTSAAVHRCRALRSRWCVVFRLCRRTPVSSQELSYPTAFVRAGDVPCERLFLVPVFVSLGLVVVLCLWWNELLSGARYRDADFRGFRFGYCSQSSPPFVSLF